jgi:hypothetical protein
MTGEDLAEIVRKQIGDTRLFFRCSSSALWLVWRIHDDV